MNKPPCPFCGSSNTTRFQWVDNDGFEYWTCWDCDGPFNITKELMGQYDKYWEMKAGGHEANAQEIYKCKGCGAETRPANGWNGEPATHHCKPGCGCSDWRVGAHSRAYTKNFDAIFPDSPGAGI